MAVCCLLSLYFISSITWNFVGSMCFIYCFVYRIVTKNGSWSTTNKYWHLCLAPKTFLKKVQSNLQLIQCLISIELVVQYTVKAKTSAVAGIMSISTVFKNA